MSQALSEIIRTNHQVAIAERFLRAIARGQGHAPDQARRALERIEALRTDAQRGVGK